MSNIYAPNLLTRRRGFWDLLSNHKNMFPDMPWLIGGDFYSPLNMEDKYGGRINMISSMKDFRNFLDNNALIDLNLKGNRYTQSNRRIGFNFIQRRLDRISVSQDWLDNYPNTNLT